MKVKFLLDCLIAKNLFMKSGKIKKVLMQSYYT